MPLLLVPLVVLGVVLLGVIMLPWSILRRYRMGTARRLARGWVATINAVGLAISAGLVLVTAALSSVWIPGSFTYSASGLAAGCLLGLIGLGLTRWESTPRTLHYTPNRWLVLSITLAVVLRLSYTLIRGWRLWHTAPEEDSWIAQSGLEGSMAAGALVLGYYLTFWIGVSIYVRKQKAKK